MGLQGDYSIISGMCLEHQTVPGIHGNTKSVTKPPKKGHLSPTFTTIQYHLQHFITRYLQPFTTILQHLPTI